MARRGVAGGVEQDAGAEAGLGEALGGADRGGVAARGLRRSSRAQLVARGRQHLDDREAPEDRGRRGGASPFQVATIRQPSAGDCLLAAERDRHAGEEASRAEPSAASGSALVELVGDHPAAARPRRRPRARSRARR